RPRCIITAPVTSDPVSSTATLATSPLKGNRGPISNPAVAVATINSHVGTFTAENDGHGWIGSLAGGYAGRGVPDGTRAGGGCCAWASWLARISATSAAD